MYLVTGLVIYFFMCPLQRAATLEWDWIAFVVVRNILMYWITFGGTHHLLYVSATKDELVKKGLKFNPKFPGEDNGSGGWAPLTTTFAMMLTGRGKELHGMAQHSHDCFMTHCSCLISAGLEVGFLHGWASGRLPLLSDAEFFTPYSILLMISLPFFRNAHFYATHRMMHCKFLCELDAHRHFPGPVCKLTAVVCRQARALAPPPLDEHRAVVGPLHAPGRVLHLALHRAAARPLRLAPRALLLQQAARGHLPDTRPPRLQRLQGPVLPLAPPSVL